MKISKYLWSVSLLLVGMFGFQSCNEETYDVVGNPDNLFFLKTDYNFEVIRYPMGGAEAVRGDEVLVKIPVYVTRPMGGEVSVSASIDASLVAQYNTANSVEFDTIDESLIVWGKKTVKFLPGAYVASDSIEFSIPKENCVQLLNKSYVIPIRLTESSDGKISVTNSYSYTVVNCKYSYIDPESNEVSGVKLTDKSYWQISSDDSSADLSVCIDGETSTITKFEQLENPTITIDLQSVNKISGATVFASNNYWEDLNYVALSLSSDGENWTDICELTGSANSSEGWNVVMLGSMDARYLKFSLGWYYGNYAYYRGLGEIDIYVTE